ncbi:MAG: glutamate--tRNA ligase [Rickettsiales bacterium]|nr:glutamate--tRNA ligase [Rickettsiales bacterium]
MSVVTRFAPSPTGYLHIGGARTALFCWLYARHHGGTFRLRIEDTDRARSTDDAVRAILDGLQWMGIDWDAEPVMQFARAARHREVAEALLASGAAYRCYATQDELETMRAEATAAGKAFRYDGRWRDKAASDAPPNAPFVIRIKAPTHGEIVIHDLVQGEVRVACAELDDMVLLRSDGTPTYMLAVVVDDHDMQVSHVIRGDDHLTNAFRQALIYQGMGWKIPHFAHIPLIHGPDGAKLSKRHGALGVEAYRDLGYLPEALRNYLLRLGWSHGDAEIISDAQAVEWFDLANVGRSPSRFDMTKLDSVNAHYVRERDDESLSALTAPFIETNLKRALSQHELTLLRQAMAGLKQRANTLVQLAQNAAFYFAARPLTYNDKALALLNDVGKNTLQQSLPAFEALSDWSHDALVETGNGIAANLGIKLGALMNPIRAAITGSNASPSMFEVMALLGKAESLARLHDAIDSK